MNKIIFYTLLSCIIHGCGPKINKDYETFPDWINNPPTLCTGGIHKHQDNLSSGRTYAIAKARTDLGRKLETKVKSMVQVYEQSGEESSKSFNESLYTNVISNLTKIDINGSSTKKIETNSKYVFVLVCLDPSSITKVFSDMKVLNETQRKALLTRSFNMQREMESQLKQY